MARKAGEDSSSVIKKNIKRGVLKPLDNGQACSGSTVYFSIPPYQYNGLSQILSQKIQSEYLPNYLA